MGHQLRREAFSPYKSGHLYRGRELLNVSSILQSDSPTNPPQTLCFNHQPNLQSIGSALELLLDPGSTAELRILDTRCRTVSGYFRDPEKSAEAALQWGASAPGGYITLNPVNPDLYARAAPVTGTEPEAFDALIESFAGVR
jgi:hypothetical protein